MTAQEKTLNLNGVGAPNVQTEGNEIEPTLTKETIQLKNTRTVPTTAQTMPTRKMRAYLDAKPGWANEPFAMLFQAGFSFEDFAFLIGLAKAQGDRVQAWLAAHKEDQRLEVQAILDAEFSKEERAILVPAQKAVVAANESIRLKAQTLIVPASPAAAWKHHEFHVIATEGTPGHAMNVSPTDPERRELNPLSVEPSDHPVHTAKVGDKWSHMLDGEQSPVYVYIGKFRRIGTFEDPDTGWKNYVIREVVAH